MVVKAPAVRPAGSGFRAKHVKTQPSMGEDMGHRTARFGRRRQRESGSFLEVTRESRGRVFAAVKLSSGQVPEPAEQTALRPTNGQCLPPAQQ